MTRFIYALKEIRACLEAELLTDVQQRLALLSRDMDMARDDWCAVITEATMEYLPPQATLCGNWRQPL